jgi:hypothetical protein
MRNRRQKRGRKRRRRASEVKEGNVEDVLCRENRTHPGEFHPTNMWLKRDRKKFEGENVRRDGKNRRENEKGGGRNGKGKGERRKVFPIHIVL